MEMISKKVLIGKELSSAVSGGKKQASVTSVCPPKKRAVATENPLIYGSVDEIGTLLRQPKVVIRFFKVLNQST